MVSTLDGEVDEEVQPGVEAAARSSHGAAAAEARGDEDGGGVDGDGSGGNSPSRQRAGT